MNKKKLAMSPSSTVHDGQYDGQYDTKYVTFEQLLHAAFMVDRIWVDKLEPVRTPETSINIRKKILGFLLSGNVYE